MKKYTGIKVIFSFANGRNSMPKGSREYIIRRIKNCTDPEIAKQKARKMFPNPLYKIVDYWWE